MCGNFQGRCGCCDLADPQAGGAGQDPQLPNARGEVSSQGQKREQREEILENRIPGQTMLLEKGGGEINDLSAENRWKMFPEPIVIDSGASETVIPQEWFENYPTFETEASRNNEWYTAANGGKIHNLGEKMLTLSTTNGCTKRNMKFQVCDKIGKALGSVSRMVHNGNRVVFDSSGSYIECKADRTRIPLREQGGVFVLDAWVEPYRGSEAQQGFGRQDGKS